MFFFSLPGCKTDLQKQRPDVTQHFDDFFIDKFLRRMFFISGLKLSNDIADFCQQVQGQ